MLKKVMLFLMILETAGKLSATAFLLSTGTGRLPGAVYLSVGFTILLGICLTCKSLMKPVSKRDLSFFYGLTACSVIFNLIYIKLFSRVEVSMLELFVIGTVMDIIVSALLVFLTVRESKYVRVHVHSEQP